MTEPTITIIAAICGCTAFWQLIDHLIEARRKQGFDIDQAVRDIQRNMSVLHDNQEDIKQGLAKTEKDSVRTQLLLLMSDYPDNAQEIMGVAQHYFDDIGGNWYMTSMFNRWLEREQIGRPDWFKG